MSKKVQTVDKVVESMMRFAKKLSKDGQSAMGIKVALWAEQIEQAVERERWEWCLPRSAVLNGFLHDCRSEVARIRMATRMREQQHYYGN